MQVRKNVNRNVRYLKKWYSKIIMLLHYFLFSAGPFIISISIKNNFQHDIKFKLSLTIKKALILQVVNHVNWCFSKAFFYSNLFR